MTVFTIYMIARGSSNVSFTSKPSPLY